ncbi:ankyrin repeat domain-containing protein 26-like isoform X1 [Lemur catta]|uniref:ankyrin repeat domain-containing protein 26-like isoform X1 n=1 Tax=Lemur catta TaxID=9447 RepID=UPI001E26E389|nr:ankyrin repeat domain-containing protein 26-like isoform X1 [Lemur catta]
MENEVCDRPAKKTPNEKNKVKEQIQSMSDHDDLTWSSATAPEDYFVILLKMQDAILSQQRLVELKSNECERLTIKIGKMENEVSILQDELYEAKKIMSQLNYEKAVWECELSTLRCTLKEEGEKRRNADLLYENTREEIRKKEEECRKEVEMKQQAEESVKTLNAEMNILRNYLSELAEKYNKSQRQLYGERNARQLQGWILANQLYTQTETEMTLREMESQIYQSYEKERFLMRTNDMLHEEIAMLQMEIATIKYQNEEKENKYINHIKIVEEVNENLQMTMKKNVEKLTDTVSQYSDQLNALACENALLNAQLQNEKESKEQLQAELESCSSRLTAAIHDQYVDQILMSGRDVEMSFQRAGHEWFCLRNEINVPVSDLKENHEIFGQNCSKAQSQIGSLEDELHSTRNVLRDNTLSLECVQRHLYQTECQMEKINQMYENEQYQVKKYIGQQEYLEKRISELERGNMLLREQLVYAHSRAEHKEETLMNMREQFQDTVKNLLAENGKQTRLLEDRSKQLIGECNQLKERLYQNEKGKPEEAQAASEEYRRQLRENHLAAISSQREFRMNNLESQVSNMTTAPEDFHCIELEKYKHFYQLELEDRKYLPKKLKIATERPAAFSSSLVAETQETRSFSGPCTMSTESASAGTVVDGLGLHREFPGREYSLFSSSCPWTLDTSLKNNLSEMQQELEEITVGLEVGAAGYSPLEEFLL